MRPPHFYDVIGMPWEFCLNDHEIRPVRSILATMARDTPDQLYEYLDDPIRRANLLCSLATTREGETATLNKEMHAFFQGNGPKVLDAVSALLKAIRQTHTDDLDVFRGIDRVEAKLFSAEEIAAQLITGSHATARVEATPPPFEVAGSYSI